MGGAAIVAALLAGTVRADGYTGNWAPSSGQDISGLDWAEQTNADELAGLVKSPTSQQHWRGALNPAEDWVGLMHDGPGSRGWDVGRALEKAGEGSLYFPSPWKFVGQVAIATVGSYVAYKLQGLFWHWTIGGGWSGSSGSSAFCGTFDASGSGCVGKFLSAGSHVGTTYNNCSIAGQAWVTIPTSGWYAFSTQVTTCGSGGSFLGWAVGDSRVATTDSMLNATGHAIATADDGTSVVVWSMPADPTTWQPTGAPQPDTIAPYVAQGTPNGDLTSHAGNPTNTTIADSLRGELTGPNDTCGGSACPWGSNNANQAAASGMGGVYDCVITGCSSDALSSSVNAPNCVGLTVTQCETAFRNAGFQGSFVETHLTIDGADVTKPAGAVVTTDPAGGASVSTANDATVTLNVNPDPLPLVLPQPDPNETYSAYIARLQGLGWVGTYTSTRLDEAVADGTTGPSGVVTVQIGTGTKTGTVLRRSNWPASSPRIEPDAQLQLDVNPDTVPPVDGGGTGGGGSGCNCPPLDFTPIEHLDPGNVFPFGVWSWISGGFVGQDANAPSFTVDFSAIPFLNGCTTCKLPVDLSSVDPLATVLRALIGAAVIIFVIWGLAHRLQGWGVPE